MRIALEASATIPQPVGLAWKINTLLDARQ
jgi:hypothetical protein